MQVQLPTTTLSAGDKDQLSIQGIQHDSITLLLQPSDVPKPPASLKVTFKPNHSFLFALTSSITRRLAGNPQIQSLQWRNYGENYDNYGENPGRLTLHHWRPNSSRPWYRPRRHEW